MPGPNPHTFPLVPLADLPPEQAVRSGMGGWEPYGLACSSDRLLPWVLGRLVRPSNAPWVSCAWIINDNTGQKVAVLVPTGSQAGVPVPNLGLVLTKLSAGENEYFTYDGALIPGLVNELADAGITCATPLRLIVDNLYQSPLFYSVGPSAGLPAKYLLLEWYHNGPLAGVPYGRGFRQRLYVINGALQWNEPVENEVTQKDTNTGHEVQLSYAAYKQRTATFEPAPDYLVDALTTARGHDVFLADGEPWEVKKLAGTAAGPDGGRVTTVLTLQDKTPFLSRGCEAAPLAVVAYDPAADAPRGWRCEDTTDTAPDVRPTGSYTCEVVNGAQTGNAVLQYQDYNPYSSTYGQYSYQTKPDPRCPAQQVYQSAAKSATVRKQCPDGQIGSYETYTVPAGSYQSVISQADADSKAQTAANAGAQTHADQVGTCSVPRTVAVTNYTTEGTTVPVMVERSDSMGQLVVQVAVSAQVIIDGSGGQTGNSNGTATITIADGNTQGSGQAAFGDDQVQSVNSVQITSTTPSDYTF